MKNYMESVQRRNVIWNAIAGLINAAEAVIVLAVVSRVNGLKEAGILTIAFSLANLFMTIGKAGMRNYQVAHEGCDFSFKTFFTSRIFTTALMIVVTILYVQLYFWNGQYSLEKSMTIFWVCMWYALEAFEDVFGGMYQVRGRLDVGSKIFSVRWLITIGTFIAVDIILQDIVKASFYAFLAGLIVCVFLIFLSFSKFGRNEKECSQAQKGLGVLFKESIILCISSFLYYYVTNIPKYAINSLLSDEVQAIYGYISMPIFVISLLNSFIYQPQLTNYVVEWREKKTKQFLDRVVRQLIIVMVIMVVCLAGAFVLGIPVLSILYHENLTEYRMHLLILLVGGGFLAIGAFCASMLTIIDEQRKVMVGYLVTAATGVLIVNNMVENFQLTGAVWGYTLNMLLLALIFCGVLGMKVKEKGAK